MLFAIIMLVMSALHTWVNLDDNNMRAVHGWVSCAIWVIVSMLWMTSHYDLKAKIKELRKEQKVVQAVEKQVEKPVKKAEEW